jgi:hypothetical protein
MHPPRLRWVPALLAAALVAPSAAMADITPARTDADAFNLAKAIAVDPSVVVEAGTTFSAIAPAGAPEDNFDPAALSTTALGTFPRNGDSYAILSTGDAKIADDPNESDSSGVGMGYDVVGRGNSAHDVLTWKVGLNVPANANCLVVRFRFLSEEFPEFVNQGVNDAFVAELDTSDWVTDDQAHVTAPGNFAYDEKGNPITVDATGAATATAEAAAGTTYDGATRRLAAAKAVTPGAHSLYLSIFDQGDDIYDSAVFVDDLQLINVDPGRCPSGAFQDDAAPSLDAGGNVPNAPEPLVSNGQFTQDDTPTFGGKAGTTLNDDPNITGTIYGAASIRATPVNGTAVQSKTVKVGADGTWTMTADALPEGSYVFQASQGSSNGQSTVTDPVSFSVDKTAPAPAVGGVGFGDKTRDATPLLAGTAGVAAGDAAALTIKLYAGKTATGTPVQTLPASVANGAWNAQAAALKDGAYTAVVAQGDAAGHIGSGTRTFTVTTKNPVGKVKLPKKLSRSKAAKGLKGSLKFGFAGKVTFALSAKVGKKTIKIGTVKRTLTKPGKAAFAFKPNKKSAAKIRSGKGTLTLKTTFVDDQGRKYTKSQKVSFR